MFLITDKDIDHVGLRAQMILDDCGGFVCFEGWVRNHHEGKAVEKLEYESYPPLAHKEGEKIINEAKAKFGVDNIICHHRVGELGIGGMAVWVGVSTPHRGEAFDACRYVIDEIKFRVPIWKKEYYVDGETGWVKCVRCAQHGHKHAEHEHSHQKK